MHGDIKTICLPLPWSIKVYNQLGLPVLAHLTSYKRTGKKSRGGQIIMKRKMFGVTWRDRKQTKRIREQRLTIMY